VVPVKSSERNVRSVFVLSKALSMRMDPRCRSGSMPKKLVIPDGVYRAASSTAVMPDIFNQASIFWLGLIWDGSPITTVGDDKKGEPAGMTKRGNRQG